MLEFHVKDQQLKYSTDFWKNKNYQRLCKRPNMFAKYYMNTSSL